MRAEERIICQSCGAECYTRERICWKCGESLAAPPPTPLPTKEPVLAPESAPIVMRLTFCKACGQQNDEEATECRKCGKPLEVVPLGSVPEVKPPPRSWGFDVLGSVWIVLGLAALFAGEFLIKTDPKQSYASIGDYMWTLVFDSGTEDVARIVRRRILGPRLITAELNS